ncbi:unannotated protein [freshwater metagenome]|uniref:Unannotated protein n=1 Tax=freshwater metagenome TaxID=449393 RepID=A0A6J6CPQ0_9ZZZZ
MILRSVVLVAVWVLLQGELTVGNVVAGVLVAVAISLLFPMHPRAAHRVHPIGAAVFALTLLRDLVASAWVVLVAVLRPTPERVHTEVVPVQLSTHSRLVASLVANSITLTPGTMTVDVDLTPEGHRLDVHVLGRVDHDDFVRSIRDLERRVLRAVEPLDDGPSGSATEEAP